MSAIERYMAELGDALAVRGRIRRRVLRECRDHLLDAACERGESAAVEAFGEPWEIARAIDSETALRRGQRSTGASALALGGMGVSTLVLISAADPASSASTGTAITFFVAAQIAGVCASLALLQALAIRHRPAGEADLRLLSRRNAGALIAATMTLVAAGGALPGRGSAPLLLLGPALVCVAAVTVVRAGSLARAVEPRAQTRPPLADLDRILPLPIPRLSPGRLLYLTTFLAAVAAFVRDRAEHGTIANALAVAGVETVAVVACFVVLGGALGLRGD